MAENISYENSLSVGKYIFQGPTLREPLMIDAQPTLKQVTRLWEVARLLGELGWAADVLYAKESLQGIKMTQAENRACHKDMVMYWRRYCPNISNDITNIELHTMMMHALEPYRPRFSRRDVQAVFLAFQRWKNLSGKSLPSRRMKSWVGRGLSMIMSSRYYKMARPHQALQKNPVR